MKRKYCIAILLMAFASVLLPNAVEAQTRYKFEDENGTYYVEYKSNAKAKNQATRNAKSDYTGFGEFRLGMGYNPYTPSGYASTLYWKDYPVVIPPNTRLHSTRWFTTNLDLGGWVKRWLYIGADVSWTTGYERVSSVIDRSPVDAFSYNNITLMPMIRFAWVNRGMVQLYSSLGLGATYEFYENTLTSEIQRFGVAYDVTFFGIAVGRKWFGYLDIGAGNRGIISAGFGYRFNNK